MCYIEFYAGHGGFQQRWMEESLHIWEDQRVKSGMVRMMLGNYQKRYESWEWRVKSEEWREKRGREHFSCVGELSSLVGCCLLLVLMWSDFFSCLMIWGFEIRFTYPKKERNKCRCFLHVLLKRIYSDLKNLGYKLVASTYKIIPKFSASCLDR